MVDKEDKTVDAGKGTDWLSSWIARAGALALVLTAWLGAFLPPDSAKPLAFGGAAAFTAAYAAYEYWRGRHKVPPRPAGPTAPVEASILRSFLPFEDGDVLVGRRSDVADILVILLSTGFRFGVIWGESGCGKTSFLRAGVVPELRKRGMEPVYLNRPTEDPIAEVERALANSTPEVRVFAIIDQFEEYFLTHGARGEVTTLGKRLDALLKASPRCAVVIAVRRDFFARLQSLAPDIPDPTSPRTTYELENLRADAAREVLVLAAADDAVAFESALIDAVIEDLEEDRQVWPVDLQLIGTRLKRAKVRQRAVYVTLGRKRGMIGTFIRDEIKRLPKPILGEIVLRRLCAPGGVTKSPIDVTLEAIVEDVRSRDPTFLAGVEIQICLQMLLDARIIVRTGDDTFNLSHDALAPLIQRGTTGLQGKTEAADRSLAFYLVAFREDRSVRIPLRNLLQIRRHATPETLADELVRTLLRKSWRSAVVAVTWPAGAALCVLLATGYTVAWCSWSIGTAPAAVTNGRPAIVVRSGTSYLRFLPGTDVVMDDTRLRVDQISPSNPVAAQRVPRGELWGFGAPRRSVEQIASLVEQVERIAFLRLAGKPDLAASTFVSAVNEDKSHGYFLTRVSTAMGLVGRADADRLSDDLVKSIQLSADASQGARVASDMALLRISEVRPDVRSQIPLTLTQATGILKQHVVRSDGNIKINPSWDTLQISDAMELLALNGPSQPGNADLAALESILDDDKNDPWARTRDFRLLVSYAARNEPLAGSSLAFLLKTSIIAPKRIPWLASGAARIMPILARSQPLALKDPVVVALLMQPQYSELNDEKLADLAVPISLLGAVDGTALPAQFAEKLKERLHDSKATEQIRILAAIGLAHLSSANPLLRDPEVGLQVVNLLRDDGPKIDASLLLYRQDAASAAAMLATSNQLDVVSLQVVLHALPGLLREMESARDEFRWDSTGLDSVLERLVHAGATVDAQTVDGIIATIEKPAFSGGEQEAANLLIAAAEFAPTEVLNHAARLDKVGYLRGLGGDFDDELRAKILAALGRASSVGGSATERAERCRALLLTRRNAEEWQKGAYCTFFLALDEPAQTAQLRTELHRILEGELAEGLAARLALEMLASVQRVEEAKKDVSVAALTRARLYFDQRAAETHIQIAAHAALLHFGEGQH